MARKKALKSSGRPEWEPTPEQRKTVRAMAQRNIPQEIIADCVDVSAKTLRKHCEKELRASALGKADLVTSAWELARTDASLMKFMLAVHLGWSSTRADNAAADKRRFAHEKEMAILRAQLGQGLEDRERPPPVVLWAERPPESLN